MAAFTCINCNIRFANAEFHREHYKTDWHRYNLKRRIAALPPVTGDEFQKRVLKMHIADSVAIEEKQTTLYCNACHKQFSSNCSHDNHLNSKKHKENLVKFNQVNGEVKEVTTKTLLQRTKHQPMLVEEDIDEVDSDEWEDVGPNPIADNNCIFCNEHSEDLIKNLKHMSIAHSFFVPDIEYCTDLEGLLFYLGAKVFNHFICLWCNDTGKTFYTLDAVRKHMIDKGHCQMLHEGIALAEYAEFYDYSSSYPDKDEGMDIDEEFIPDLLDGDEYQLVLPSGAVIGHRSLLRYYKQRLNPHRVVTVHKSDRKLHKVLSQYRALGWTNTEQKAAARRARDIHLMKRVQAKWQMKLGVKANKLQSHFREQVTDSEFRRIREAFKKSAGPGSTFLSQNAFQQDVLCEGIPLNVSELLYVACGGTQKGISFKDVFCGLVLLTRGTEEDKVRFLWNLYCNDSGTYLLKSEYTKSINLHGNEVLSLFANSDRVNFDQFREWILNHRNTTVLSKWLLSDTCINLTSELETPTFYQSLAGVTHLEEKDIGDLEKEFWRLKSTSITEQLDLQLLGPLISPPIPKTALAGMFSAFDENRDGHIDFKELCCGVSAACRGPNVERCKFCFKIFDIDRDGILNYEETIQMIDILVFVTKENHNVNTYKVINRNDVISDLLTFTRKNVSNIIQPTKQFDSSDVATEKLNLEKSICLTQEDFMMWNVESSLNLVQPFLDLTFEVCHIIQKKNSLFCQTFD